MVSHAVVATAIEAVVVEEEEDEEGAVAVAEGVATKVKNRIHTQAWQHDAVAVCTVHLF